MKILLILICSFVLLQADMYTQKLYEKILGSIFKERPIRVFAVGDAKEILQKSTLIKVLKYCDENNVDVIVGGKVSYLENNCTAIPIFATTHRAYVRLDNAFAAFYWRKGRPQIHFNKQKIKLLHLHLPKNLQRYIDE